MDELENKVKEDLQIDDTNLGGELKRQASKYFYWATMKAKATSKSRMKKAFLEQLKAEKSKAYKESVTSIDPKVRVTERMLDDYLELDEDVQKAKTDYTSSVYIEDLLSGAEDALRQRHYALIELTRSREAERMSINEYEKMKRDFEESDRAKK